MTLINKIINHNNDSYITAKSCLTKIKDRLDNLVKEYPDVTPSEIMFVKDIWNRLPMTMGEGVCVMGIELRNDFKSLLSHFKKGAQLFEHEHDVYELNKIIKGSITNVVTGETYKDGDTFIIKKNEKHHLLAEEETFVYCILTDDESLLITPKVKPILLKHFNNVIPG